MPSHGSCALSWLPYSIFTISVQAHSCIEAYLRMHVFALLLTVNQPPRAMSWRRSMDIQIFLQGGPCCLSASKCCSSTCITFRLAAIDYKCLRNAGSEPNACSGNWPHPCVLLSRRAGMPRTHTCSMSTCWRTASCYSQVKLVLANSFLLYSC